MCVDMFLQDLQLSCSSQKMQERKCFCTVCASLKVLEENAMQMLCYFMSHTVLISEQIIDFQQGDYLKDSISAFGISINHKHGEHTYLRNVTHYVTGVTAECAVPWYWHLIALLIALKVVIILKTIELFIRFLSKI